MALLDAGQRREHAFATLYELSERSFGQSAAQVDAAHRALEDYVFGELEYTRSKTCCWNSSTSAMYDIIMKRARAQLTGTCVAPTVFKSQLDDYQGWASYAQTLGRGTEWRPWTEDEPCTQRATASDVEVPPDATPYCALNRP